MTSYFVWAATSLGSVITIILTAVVASVACRTGHRLIARVALIVSIACWPLVVVGGGLAFGGGLPTIAAAVIAALAIRDAMADLRSRDPADPRSPDQRLPLPREGLAPRQERQELEQRRAVHVLSGAVYAVAQIQVLVNRPDVIGLALTVAIAVLVATAVRRRGFLPPAASRKEFIVRGIAVVTTSVVVVALFALWQGRSSVLPDSYSLMPADHDMAAQGQTPAQAAIARANHSAGGHSPGTANTATESAAMSVADLRARPATGPVRRVAVTARVDGDRWVFQPRELRVRQGELLEVTVVNELPQATSVHWHGVDVPNSEDGVPGLTQDAIAPGQARLYAFDAVDAGSYWFHSHQDAVDQIPRGMFGALVVLPADGVAEAVDQSVLLHTWPGQPQVELADPNGLTSASVEPGRAVRLRVTNTDDIPHRVDLRGTAFRVVAVDGHDLTGPGLIETTAVDIPAGGRADLSYVQPAGSIGLFSGDSAFTTGSGSQPAPSQASAATFDPLSYGAPAPDPITMGGSPDIAFDVIAENRLGWYDGAFGARVALNGRLYPDGDMLMVRTGELVQITITNRSFVTHPMHLHGHSFSVLSRNGGAPTGSPIRVDSIDVAPGDTVVIAFRADNPGLWMFHCHNNVHAAAGMDLMVGYVGVNTPFRAGPATGNSPQ